MITAEKIALIFSINRIIEILYSFPLSRFSFKSRAFSLLILSILYNYIFFNLSRVAYDHHFFATLIRLSVLIIVIRHLVFI